MQVGTIDELKGIVKWTEIEHLLTLLKSLPNKQMPALTNKDKTA